MLRRIALRNVANTVLTYVQISSLRSSPDSADNISFLLRVAELVGNSFECQSVVGSDDEKPSEGMDGVDASKKLTTVCRAAREALLKYVETDANLAPYPAPVQIPAIFKRRQGGQFKATKLDLAQERKRIAALKDDEDDFNMGDDGGEQAAANSERSEERRAKPGAASEASRMGGCVFCRHRSRLLTFTSFLQALP